MERLSVKRAIQMKLFSAIAVAATLAVAGSAVQAAPIYATSVVSFTKGSVKRVEAGRSDPTKALGMEDGGFVSLGFGGTLVLAFDAPFRAIGQVFEVTLGSKTSHKESADLYAGDGMTWTLIGSLKNYISTSFSRPGQFTMLKIVDTTSTRGASFDGFDVDAVAVSPIPVPAAGLLLGGSLLGLGALRRRKPRAA
jgi:hypothetical protein